MPLRFRNIDVTPAVPVEAWGFEGMLAAIGRGFAADWRKLIAAVVADPALRSVKASSPTASVRLGRG